MCGIAGILFGEQRDLDRRAVVERMTAALMHRGPDECGYHLDSRAALGHRRLSIIDLKSGQQPMYNEDETVCVIFNGEIYNFKEIRRYLIQEGHTFRTNSDTETIVHAYETWGEACVDKFRGMFAFAIRDQRDDTLFLARDRFGKKPLFYAWHKGQFVFASEMKSILVDPAFERCIDDEALAAYFTLSYIPAPMTIFRGIRKLPAGHTLTVGSKGSRQRQYWDISFRPDTRRSEADFIEEFRQRMRTAVGLRLISDVPLGAFLSGGIDSSAVVAFMAQANSDPINTFTIGFGGGANADEDERAYARLVAERYRTNHRELEVLPRVDGLIESIVRSFDEPFADDSTVPSYYVCKMARENVTVALSGLGGDEAFAGYERYLGFRLSQSFHRLPASARSLFSRSVERLPESRSNRINHVKRFARSASLDDAQRYLGFMTKIGSAYRDQLFAERSALRDTAMTSVRDRFIALFRNADAEDPLDKVFYCDVKTYLTDDILALTDRISMAHSLEVRVPFLDHELFEFTATIPARLKLKWFRKKYLLKKALEDLLPRPVLAHKKRGFVGPLPTWLREDAELRAYALRVLAPPRLARHGLLDPSTVSRVLSDHFEGRETNDTLIWALIIFQTWFELYIEKNVIEPEAAAARWS